MDAGEVMHTYDDALAEQLFLDKHNGTHDADAPVEQMKMVHLAAMVYAGIGSPAFGHVD